MPPLSPQHGYFRGSFSLLTCHHKCLYRESIGILSHNKSLWYSQAPEADVRFSLNTEFLAGSDTFGNLASALRTLNGNLQPSGGFVCFVSAGLMGFVSLLLTRLQLSPFFQTLRHLAEFTSTSKKYQSMQLLCSECVLHTGLQWFMSIVLL